MAYDYRLLNFFKALAQLKFAIVLALSLFATSALAQETNCTDGIDNDGDGLIDCLDPDCPQCATAFTCSDGYTFYMPPIYVNKNGFSGTTGSPSDLYLTTYGSTASVTVKTPDGSFSRNVLIPPGNPQTLAIPDDVITTLTVNTGLPLNTGLIVTSDQPIQATYRLLSFYNQDIASLLGKSSVGYSFYPGSQTDLEASQLEDTERHFVSVMALENNTTVTFKNPMALEGHAPGTFTAVINKGQSYVVSSPKSAPNTSISGVRVTSNRPIVCVGGSEHSNTPQGLDYDAGIEQVIPAHIAGNTYAAVDGGNPNSVKDYLTIIAIENNTDVQINNQFVTNLQAGQVYTYKFSDEIYKSYVITSANKLYVYHHATYGSSEFGSGLLPPINSCVGSKRVDFERPGAEAKAIVVIPTAGLSTLKLRGRPYTTYAGAAAVVVPNLNGYSRVVFDDKAIAPLGVNNRIESESLFSVGVLSRSGGTGNYAYYSDYEPKIEVIDPFTNQPATSIQGGDVVPGQAKQVCLQISSCGSGNRINAVTPGDQTQAVTFNDNCITYTMKPGAPTCASDVLVVSIVNEFGIAQNICVNFSNQSKDIVLTTAPANPQLCSSGGTVSLTATATSGAGITSYQWVTPQGSIVNAQNITASTSGPYALTIINNNGCVLRRVITVGSRNCIDFDNDNVNDNVDLDDDNDGILDTAEGTADTDGDGTPNSKDLDSDNDGIADVSENGGADYDGDGFIDGFVDTNGNGLADNLGAGGLTLKDADGDGKANSVDIDSDNDGITDITEVRGADENSDGKIDNFADQDGDGYSDNVDFSEGGSPIFTTSQDTNNNGLPDGLPPQTDDRDSDGKVNFLDIDADNDGIVDVIESQLTVSYIAPAGADTDNDGLDNAYDNVAGFGGSGNNPLLANTDGGSAPDYVDTDADNDGKADNIEGWDTNGNGSIDGAEKVGGAADIDNDGLPDGYDANTAAWNPTNGTTPTSYPNNQNPGTAERDWRDNTAGAGDADGDGIADTIDVDDDNDGILDVAESSVDTDGDGIPNNRDLDSDNDGVPDLIENGGVDTNGDGRVDNFTDTDGDGLANIYDPDNGGLSAGYKDFDGDGVANAIDIDADNDGITDIVEVRGDDFTTGVFNGRVDNVIDVDGDGFSDKIDPIIDGASSSAAGTPIIVAVDTNNDGVPDSFPDDNPDTDIYPIFLDIDADNDGIVDNDEAQLTAGYVAPAVVDTDNDGLDDAYDLPGQSGLNPLIANSDGGSAPDYTDRDADNDGLRDEVEGWDTDNNGVSNAIPGTADVDRDGLLDGYDANTASADPTNGGRTPASYPNLNRPGTTEVDWREKNDYDGDGIADDVDLDDDNDGILDSVEGIADTDGDGIPNNRDIDSDNDGIVDFIEAQVSKGAIKFPTTPNDADGDGILDDLDSAPASFGGSGLVPINVDGADAPDYLDLDSDNDSFTDDLEGHDYNNDGVINGTEPAGGIADVDNDGLLDGYDANIVSPFSTTALNITNGQTSEYFPNLDQPNTPQLDWREKDDFDGDGINDTADVDDDNDGVLDVTEGIADSDGDGLPDFRDLDADNDGVPDVVENGGVDVNGDGVIDCVIAANGLAGCLTGNGLELLDKDSDGIPNALDLDADNDGLGDIQEALGDALDTDHDGQVDNATDADNDGLPDAADITQSGVALLPTGADTNGKGLPDSYPNADDQDKDGIPSIWDLDSDNDAITDAVESTSTDGNGDGIFDLGSDGTTVTPAPDVNNNGVVDPLDVTIPNALAIGLINIDSDGDGIYNSFDLDSDNDGIADIVEAGGKDADSNGIVDGFTDSDNDGLADVVDPTAGGIPLITTGKDGDKDLLPDNYLKGDLDLDAIPNFLDIDSDNDGIVDNIEAQSTDTYAAPTGSDADGDGVDGAYDGNVIFGIGNKVIKPVDDTDDSDNIPDYLDLDTDGDTVADSVEGWDVNGNGVIDGTEPSSEAKEDADFDGLLDQYDKNTALFNPTNGSTPSSYPDVIVPGGDRDWRQAKDRDGDGRDDGIDIDDDNDGIPDLVESSVDPLGDADNDGVANYLDQTPGGDVISFTDANGDGIADAFDKDRDGVINAFDLDSDNDGIPDLVEAGGVDSNGDGRVDGGIVDTNGDGLMDAYDISTGGDAILNGDTEGDGLLNIRDLDSDGDGIPDVIEAGGVDADGNGKYDGNLDVDGDGFNDLVDGDVGNDGVAENVTAALIPTGVDANGDGIPDSYPKANFDKAGLSNPYDLDSDNDGLLDTREASVGDVDANGVADGVIGEDGWVDVPENVGTLDTDGKGKPNYLDIDSDDDGIVDVVEGQTTLDFKSPLNSDVDGDGIDDAFDNYDVGFGGAPGNGVTATDTDLDGSPDYIDEDTDQDGRSDKIEGWDNNGDGTINGNEPGPDGSVDTDVDGLLDQYDVNLTAFDPTNGTTPLSYPDVLTPGSDRDWRQVNETALVIPEGFSPNGDNINDLFVIQNPLNRTINIKVFNRWGNVVYSSDSYQNDWNGVATKGVVIGSVLPDGTYFVMLVIDGEEMTPKYITLKR